MTSIIDVSERKIRPIYEAIDNNSLKSALQQCNKLLKKQPEALILKALKGLILERTGKTEEALKLCDQVKEKKPIDEPILQALTMVYKSLGKFEEIVKIYENAILQNPNNEEIGNHWFMAMVRINDFKGQQQAALKLHKTFKSNKYLFWAIISLLLQAQSGPSRQSDIFLSLAERMMLKAVKEKGLKHIEDVHLYLIVLLAQKKYKEILEVLENEELNNKCKDDIEILRIRNDLLLKTENWTKANEISKNLLTETTNLDDWGYYLMYLESCLHLITTITATDNSKNENENNENCDISTKSVDLDQVREFLHSLQEIAIKNSEIKRGPFLAELELEKRAKEEIKEYKPKTEVNKLMVNYFEIFGSKACCFEDLQQYLKGIPLDSAKKIIEEFKSTINLSDDDKKSKIKNIQKNVNIYKFERFMGLFEELNENEMLSYVNNLINSYKDALQYGEELPDTEYQYGDDFIIIGSQILFDLYKKTGHNSYLFQAIFILENALKKSKHNFQFKLFLIRLYQKIGIFHIPLNLYKSMEIKHMQLDTLSHYLVERSFSLGAFEDATQACYDSLPIYRSNEIETPEMIISAYKFATFSKIQDFIEFQNELENSLQKVFIDREIIRLEFLNASKVTKNGITYLKELDVTDLKYEDEYCKNRRDNRDFAVLSNFNPINKPKFEEIIRVSPKLDLNWLKLFTFIPLILKNIYVTKDIEDIEDINSLTESLEKLLSQDYQSITLEEKRLGDVIIKLCQLYLIIKEVQSGKKESISKIDAAMDNLINSLKVSEPEDISNHTIQELSWIHFHQFSLFLEACNYSMVTIEIINNIILPRNKKLKNKELIQNIQNLNLTVKKHLEYLKKQLDIFKSIVEGEKSAPRIFEYIKAGSHIDFCSDEDNVFEILFILNKIENNWMASLRDLIQQTDCRII
ncbi:hypothetical protein Glove_396g53 [Diversispora epigaea]|uniref:Uncharacterized protein n=1 Tax=Diversispora epigaea TaxID=1348612 RepID=A0A397H116_9GLOM|nr:hypothetical protein Glove_396g53 [Diversispora epigaea]